MTVIINFLGQPSSGKTSLSVKLFAKLKELGLNAEYSPEVAKLWVYEHKKMNKYGQYVLFGEEVRQQSRLFNEVDIIISDSSPILASYYNYYYNGENSLSEACHGFYQKVSEDGIRVINFYLPRKKKYIAKGRYQTEEQANALAEDLKRWLGQEGYKYTELECSDKERIDVVLEKLRETTNDFNGMSLE